MPPALAKAKFLLLAPVAFRLCLKYKLLLAFRPVAVLNRDSPALRDRIGWPSTSDISRAVYFSARFLPGLRCLPQAFAVRDLMHRYGRPCELRIGVATAGGFRAHAWVTSGGQVVHGQTADSFVPLEAP
ncbi:MAG: lasso peptide biosynthesis B2 protein [Bryobacterales bacterium]|nr:lasso peptide biosynthesis B2 protein [Bryobacterales bacterium]